MERNFVFSKRLEAGISLLVVIVVLSDSEGAFLLFVVVVLIDSVGANSGLKSFFKISGISTTFRPKDF